MSCLTITLGVDAAREWEEESLQYHRHIPSPLLSLFSPLFFLAHPPATNDIVLTPHTTTRESEHSTLKLYEIKISELWMNTAIFPCVVRSIMLLSLLWLSSSLFFFVIILRTSPVCCSRLPLPFFASFFFLLNADKKEKNKKFTIPCKSTQGWRGREEDFPSICHSVSSRFFFCHSLLCQSLIITLASLSCVARPIHTTQPNPYLMMEKSCRVIGKKIRSSMKWRRAEREAERENWIKLKREQNETPELKALFSTS